MRIVGILIPAPVVPAVGHARLQRPDRAWIDRLNNDPRFPSPIHMAMASGDFDVRESLPPMGGGSVRAERTVSQSS